MKFVSKEAAQNLISLQTFAARQMLPGKSFVTLSNSAQGISNNL